MKVLFAVGEAWPFIKTGGLGDVAYSLPKVLKNMGNDVRVILPKYSQIEEKYREKMIPLGNKNIWVAHHNEYVGIECYDLEDVTYYFIDGEKYFYRSSTYGQIDDCERFTYFCKAVVETFDITGFYPDIIHCNDWHTGLIPIYLRERGYWNIKTIYTIHNLRFQGLFFNDNMEKILELPRWAYYYEDGLKYYDMLSFMKGGVVYSDIVTTVSETYANEIKTPWMGEGLDGLFRKFDYKLHGVLNGIDIDSYKFPRKGKTRAKTELQEKLGLIEDPNLPMISMITRFDRQKGIDMLMEVFDDIMKTDAQMVILGTGEPYYEDFFRMKEYQYPERVCSYIGFNSNLAKEIYYASDMFLMPSIFEPCGLSQMIAMRYGTIPIVRETGGLRDTVIPYDEYANTGDGFGFKNINSQELLWCIKYAMNIYHDGNKWHDIMNRAKLRDNTWSKSAEKYIELYKSLL
ncbi:glycogen synthase [Fusobacterium sp. PH5-44]|uniref:glycogen synthase n=1 Tax=unclassified Fusobacterium TaxID=2648384 RepID=UPI003D1A0DBF